MTKKGKFLRKLNEAFARSDTDFIVDKVTDNIRWTVHGDFSLQGKKNFRETLEKMEASEPYELSIHNIITHGNSAAVDGIMRTTGGESYAFCDIYTFSGFKNPKIKELTSYVVNVKGD